MQAAAEIGVPAWFATLPWQPASLQARSFVYAI
jgi:hypothetical protein